MPKVILKFESAIIKEYPLTNSVTTAGRKPDNDIVIDHPAVSGHHLKILLQGNIYFVEDLNSTNGTLVNDKKVIKAGLANNDKISIAKHSLLFVDDRPQSSGTDSEPKAAPVAEPPAPAPAAPQPPAPKSDEMPTLKKAPQKLGAVRVIDGVVEKVDYDLTDTSTYIGKSDRVTIKIKGMMAPEVAAMISRKPEGYFLVAIKDGYPKVNGMPVAGQRQLNEGDAIEVGGTVLQFYLKNPS